MHFVLCHGFGFDPYFWHKLLPYFRNERCTCLNLGYFYQQDLEINLHLNEPVIGIGHSLGLLKLIDLNLPFAHLIGLNSFVDFLGKDAVMRQKRNLELKMLENSFKRDPFLTLKRFYTRCGVPEWADRLVKQGLNVDFMLSDLNHLRISREFPSISTLILNAEDDEIVPPNLIEPNFAHVASKHLPKGAHGLGWNHASEVYEHIMRFLDDGMDPKDSEKL